ncbi:MAG: hypothetical protein KQJ78_12925 [Deltaproteobacteria bacterium]|nr:hypothetical protein [Deltaproteobacteria bacterium]
MTRKKSAFILFCLAVCLAGLAAPASARQTVRASVRSNGVQADNVSAYTHINSTGRYVVFASNATNLVSGDTNGVTDIFRHDLLTGETVRVSLPEVAVESNGGSINSSISDDGRYVAFDSDASNLVTGDANAKRDIFLRDLVAGTTIRVSRGDAGAESNNYSILPSITGNGRYITFYSLATNLIPGGSTALAHTYRYDTQTQTTTLLDRDSVGAQGDNHCRFFGFVSPQSSADGRFSSFSSLAANLVTGDTNTTFDVFLRDGQTGQTFRASQATDGTEADLDSGSPSLTPDGRYVCFQTAATTLAADDTNGLTDVYLHDRVTGGTSRVSLAHDGAEGNGSSALPSLNSTASLVAFQSDSTNLVTGDTNAATDIFLRGIQSGAILRASVSNGSDEANGFSSLSHISGDSSYVTFQSDATNLVAGDTNHLTDIFVNGPFLEDAVDVSNVELLTPVDYAWQPSAWSPHLGISSAQSAPIADGQASWMMVKVTGPGVLSFWWRASSQAGADTLTLYDGPTLLAGPISGDTGWVQQTVSVDAGNHVLYWVYAKDPAISEGADAGWVDQVAWGASTRKTMYRAYNVALQYHFFTIKQAEFNNAVSAGYQNESSNPAKLFYVSLEQAPGTVALHRLYNPNAGRHYYTKSNTERDALVAVGWNYERDEGYLFTAAAGAPADATEVFHLYHPVIGTHLYTKSASEAAWVVANIPPWQQHTSLGWAYNSLTVGARYAAEDDPVSPDSDLLRDAALQAGVDLTRLAAWQALTAAQAGPKAEEGSTAAPAAVTSDSLAANLASLAGLTEGLGGVAGGLIPRRDFDGDGADDLVWADPATGRVNLVLMGPAGPREVVALGTLADPHWELVDVADLDASGGPDLVWWNPVTREVSFWLLTDTAVTSRLVVGQAPEGCTLAGVGDYDGDGRAELAWRAADGSLTLGRLP